MVATNRYFGIVKEHPMISDDPYPNKLNYIDIASDNITSDNQIQVADGITPDARRFSPGGFKSGGSMNLSADAKTFGILLAALLGGVSTEDIGVDGVNPGPWEHVFYPTELPPQYTFLVGRKEAEHQLVGALLTTLTFDIAGGQIQKLSADWIVTSERILTTLKTSITLADTPLLPFHMNLIEWDDNVIDAETISVSISNGRHEDAFQLATRNFASRSIVDDCDTNASGWAATAGTVLADETTIKIYGAASMEITWDAAASDGDTVTFTISDEDWRKYDRIGFWYYQTGGSGSSGDDYEVKLTNNAGAQNAQTITPDNFSNATWYYITIDISGLTRNDIESFIIAAPGDVTDDMEMYIDHIEVWKHNRAPVTKREVTIKIDKEFADETDFERFLGTTTSTGPEDLIETWELKITTDTDIDIDPGNEAFEYQLISHFPKLVIGKPGGPFLSGRDRLSQSLELTAFIDESTPTEPWTDTHASAPTSWALVFVLQNDWETY